MSYCLQSHELQCSRLPVLHCLLEFAQTHVHWVSDAIQPSHPLLPLLSLSSIFRSIRVFSNESALHIKWPKCWSFSFIINLSNEYSVIQHWFPLGLTGLISLLSRDSQVYSPVPQFKSIDSLALSLLYGPTLISIYNYWINHSSDYMLTICWLLSAKWCLFFLICCLGLS